MRVLISFFFLLASLQAAAQPLRFYIGPLVGVTTSGLRGTESEMSTPLYTYVQERRTPVVSPVLGLGTGFTLFNRIGVDAAVQYSYTGYRYSYNGGGAGLETQYDERMTLHRVAVPVTVGYAPGFARARLRIGIGAAYTYFFAGNFSSEGSSTRTGEAAQFFDHSVAVFRGNDRWKPVQPRQLQPRLSLSIAPTRKIIIGLAGNLGRHIDIEEDGTDARANRSSFVSNSLDFSLLYSLR